MLKGFEHFSLFILAFISQDCQGTARNTSLGGADRQGHFQNLITNDLFLEV